MKKNRFKEKIVIIGAGYVGSTIAYTLYLKGLASEIVLVDLNKEKAEGDALDMMHGISFVSPCKVYAGTYEDSKDADIVIITAGITLDSMKQRTDYLEGNVKVFRTILGGLEKYCKAEAIYLIVTNPVDIMTYISYKITEKPKCSILGTGTVLDTSRLKYLISKNANVDTRNIHTYIVGEHGDSEVPTWSVTNIAGMQIDKYCDVCNLCGDNRINRDDFYRQTRDAAYEIIDKKGATYYAVALATTRIVEAIIGSENSILTVSAILKGEYGINDIAVSVPTLINSNGGERVIEVPFSKAELIGLQKSADILKTYVREVGF